MNKFIFAVVFISFLFLGNIASAQEVHLQPNDRSETREIIIRKDGDKETKITVEVEGDKVLINGKPIMESNEDVIIIKKKNMMIAEGMPLMMEGNFNIEDENDSTAFLGVTTKASKDGVEIISVSKESAAEKAGLKEGDIIIKINDKKIEDPQSLSEVVTSYKPSQEVKISYIRNGKVKTTKATLQLKKQIQRRVMIIKNDREHGADGPGMPDFKNNMDLILPGLAEDLGMNGMEFNFNRGPRKQKLGIKIQDIEEGNAVKILDVADSSAAANAGLKKDDIITEIDGKKINNTDDAREQLQETKDKNKYNIKAKRNGVEMNFEIKIPKKLKTAEL
jgi:serine protease Do